MIQLVLFVVFMALWLVTLFPGRAPEWANGLFAFLSVLMLALMTVPGLRHAF